MWCRLQEQRWAAGARRHVGHAPKLRREQRGGGLLEASHSSLTTASAADLQAFDGHARRRLPDTDRRRRSSTPDPTGRNSETREQSSRSVGKCVKLEFLGTGKAAGEQETERSGEARNNAQGSRECGESGGVHGAQVARPAFGGGLNGEAGARGARRALGAGPPDSPGRLRRARSASVLHAPAPRSAPRSVLPEPCLRRRSVSTHHHTLLPYSTILTQARRRSINSTFDDFPALAYCLYNFLLKVKGTFKAF